MVYVLVLPFKNQGGFLDLVNREEPLRIFR